MLENQKIKINIFIIIFNICKKLKRENNYKTNVNKLCNKKNVIVWNVYSLKDRCVEKLLENGKRGTRIREKKYFQIFSKIFRNGYWSSNQFYNNITDDVNYTFSQSHSISFWI